LDYVIEVLQELFHGKVDFNREDRDHFLPLVRKLGFDFNSSFGIGNKEVHDKVKVSYDMMKSIQKVLAKVDTHHDFSVWHNGNIVKYGKEPIIKVENEGDLNENIK
jgi:hypothetical protein